MVWQPTLYSLFGMGVAGISVLVACQAWFHRDERGAWSFMGLMLVLSGWSLGSAVQLGVTTGSGQLLWQRVSLAIGGLVPTFWFLFTLQYTMQDVELTRSRRALLAVDPLLFAFLTLTNPDHGLVWQDVTFTSTTTVPVATLSLNAGYYVHIAYAYLLVVAGIGLLFLVFIRESAIYRKQAGLLILAALPPFIANIAFTMRVPWGPLPAVDLTPFAFAVTGVLCGLALFQFDLLERGPIARRYVLDEMGDGLVVLDDDGRIVNANTVARRAFDPTPTVDDSITEIIPDTTETAESAIESLDGRTVTVTFDGRQHAYDVDCSPLRARHGGMIGHVIALRDVTDRNEYQQRLEVAQRVLRHNLRNDMTIVRGWAEHLEKDATDEQSRAIDRIITAADDLIVLSEKTQTLIRRYEGASDDSVTVDVEGRITAIVEEFRREYPRTTIECDLAAVGERTLPGQDFLEIPVRNLLENAIEHNDVQNPWARVEGERTDEGLRIRIEDNGPDIPAVEREVLQAGTEKPLKHGSGVGLWLAYWHVTSVGGSIAFEDRKPTGNVVILDIPTATPLIRP